MVDFKPTKEHKETARKVSRLLKQYRPLLPWLWEWQGEVEAVAEHERHPEVAMSVTSFNYIMNAVISIHPPAIELDDAELELTLLHELGHIMVNEMNMAVYNLLPKGEEPYHKPGIWVDAEERFCWRFAKTVMKIRETKNSG